MLSAGAAKSGRIAARSLANRLAQELAGTPKGFVGHKIRFQDQTRPETAVKIMTDGILLAETHSDRELRAYDTIIVDEAHERSLNIDFLLGYLKRLVAARPELKVIVTSATIDAERFSQHFASAQGPAPVTAGEVPARLAVATSTASATLHMTGTIRSSCFGFFAAR